MKINSRILGVLSALFVIAMVISSAGAAEDIANGGIDSENFVIDVPEGSDFVKEATTNLNIGDFAMNMDVFENKGDNANDVSTIVYLKDSSNQNIIPDLYDDLRNDGPIVEENDKYFIVETKNSGSFDFLNFDIGNDIGSLFDSVSGIFSSDSDVNVIADNADYALCIKNPSNDQVIVIAGNNIDVLKEMAETASFTE